MSAIARRVSELAQSGISLVAHDGRLKVDGPRDAMTEDLVAELKVIKQDLITYLQANPDRAQVASVTATQQGPVRLESRDGPLQVSFAQERMWFLHEFEDLGPLYNMPIAIRLSGSVDQDALQSALRQIVQRHEVLRTAIVPGAADSPIQQIMDAQLELTCTAIDPGKDDADKQLQALVIAETSRTFSLSDKLKIRASLVRLPEQDGEACYLLLVVVHHIAADGWSIALFTHELGLFYNAAVRSDSSILPAELSIQYAEFASWQRNQLNHLRVNEQIAYWKKQLQGAPALLELPIDHPRPASQSHNGDATSLVLPASLVTSLRQLGSDQGATLFMTMLAAFQLLLARYSGQPDIIVGSPIAGRLQETFEQLIGLFVNTLVLRTTVESGSSFIELLGQVRLTALSAYQHQEVPFEKLVEVLQPTRSMSFSPIFQVMFIMQNVPEPELCLDGLSAELQEASYDTAKFDLLLEISESAEGMLAVFNYNTDLFDASTIERMAGNFQVLLEAIVQQPERNVMQLPLLTSQEQDELMAGFNNTERHYPAEKTLVDLIHDQSGQSMAVEGSNGNLSYAELDEASNRLANHLIASGVVSDDSPTLIGLYLERDTDMLVALLAVLKSGAAYVPMDPLFPRERLAMMVEDANLAVVISQSSLLDSLPGTDTRPIVLDELQTTLELSAASAVRRARPDGIAYVIYTSGSTGRPKGVRVQHRALTNLLCAMQNEPGFEPGDRLLAVTTLSFDIAMLELFLPLICGGTTIIANKEESMDPARLSQQVAESRATVMQATPATWRMLLDHGWQGAPGLKIISGGEALPRELAMALLPRCAELWNVYGPTETTIWSTASRVLPDAESISIGKPIANTQVYVLNDAQSLQPKGVSGELCIGGDGVTMGYHEQPELTEERFIPDTLTRRPGYKLYRTGDVARWRPDGTIDLLGRVDEQVKLRGFRLEPGEIRERLVEQAQIANAVVVLREDKPGDPRLVAYVVRSANPPLDDPLDIAGLRTVLQQSLPEYMVPSAWVELQALPLTPNGKVDRKALPAPASSQLHSVGGIAPTNAAESAMAAVWSKVLGVESVARDMAFFDLGGHSLLAIKLVGEMKKSLGVKVPLQRLFQGATIADLTVTDTVNANVSAVAPRYDESVCRVLRAGDSPEPLFMIGSNPRYKVAAEYISDDQGVFQLDAYALQDNRMRAGQGRLKSIEAIADAFIEQIKIQQPGGNYHLCGGCEGAFIAFEIAHRLTQSGDRIGTLVTLHMPSPGPRLRDSFEGSTLRRLWWQFQGLLEKGSVRDLGLLACRELIRHEIVTWSLFNVMFKYRTNAQVDADLHRVILEDQPPLAEPTEGWKEYIVREVINDHLPGTHESWLQENIEDFGRYLDALMKQHQIDRYLETGT